MMKKTAPALSSLIALAILLCLCTAATPAQAASGDDSGPVRQLGRGMANVLGGITEVPITIRHITKEEGEFAGLTLGTLKGLGRFLTREVVGVFEVVTFPMGRKPIVLPEFPMESDPLTRWRVNWSD